MRSGRAIGMVLLLLLLCGCWDRREIEEQSTSLATSIDTCEETDPPDCRLVGARQIAIPGKIPIGAEGAQGGSVATTVHVVRTPGKDGPDSTRKAQAKVNRLIRFGHTRLIVLGEAFARQGIGEYLDYLRRVPELRRLMWIAVSEGRAEEIIRAKPRLERVPALYLSSQIDDAVRSGRLPKIFFGELAIQISNKGQDAVVPLLRMAGPDRPAIAGLAVFRGDRMVGRLNPEETITYLQMRGIKKASDFLRLRLDQGRSADLVIEERKARYRIRADRGSITANIQIELEGYLFQLPPELRRDDPQVNQLLERVAAEEVRRRAVKLTERLQREFHADVLSIGERVRAYSPKVWASIADWHEAFADVQFSFEVRVHIRRTGMATS